MDQPVFLDAGVVNRCRRRVHLEHDPDAGPPPTSVADPTAALRIADAAAHRRAVAHRLAASAGPGWAEIAADQPFAARQARTAELAALGTPYIWAAVLPSDGSGSRRGSIDLLVWSGDGYVPVLVVRHKISDPGGGAVTTPIPVLDRKAAVEDGTRKVRSQPRDQLRLAHTVRLLRAAGWAASGPTSAGVIGLDADVVVWHDLDAPTWPGGRSAMEEYDLRFADRFAVAMAARTGADPLALPSRITACRTCPWWPRCGDELLAARDVSLILRGEDAGTLRAHGVGTVEDLAALDPVGDGIDPELSAALNGSLADAVALARAWQRGLPLVRRRREISVPRGDVELDIDMESFGDAGAYMWGCLLSGVDIGMEPGYRAFATWDPVPTRDEGRSFAEFWAWLTAVRAAAAARSLTLRAYCYNELAENRWMLSSAARFAGMPGVPTAAEIKEFITSPQWIDLFTVVGTEFLCPQGKGLKTIAPAAGFSWHDPDAGGENSMRWYRDAVGLESGEPDLTQRDRLLVYNSDDVHATQALRHWLTDRATDQVPYVGDLTPLPV